MAYIVLVDGEELLVNVVIQVLHVDFELFTGNVICVDTFLDAVSLGSGTYDAGIPNQLTRVRNKTGRNARAQLA